MYTQTDKTVCVHILVLVTCSLTFTQTSKTVCVHILGSEVFCRMGTLRLYTTSRAHDSARLLQRFGE